MVVKRRTTNRKAIIERILWGEYRGGPVLLEELRWKVLMEQYGPNFTEMTDAKMKSFARTIREHFPDYLIQKIPLDNETPVGLVARAAVYRLKNLNQLRHFLHGADPCILCRYQTNVEVDEPQYWSGRYVIPCHHAATFRFFAKRPVNLSYEIIQRVPGTFIPLTQKLSLVVPLRNNADYRSVAAVTWGLFGYNSLNDWYKADPNEGLGAVMRNRGY